MKKISNKDVATALGLSPSTVSRALRDHPDICEFTKDRICNYIYEHQSICTDKAFLNKKKQKKCIGVIVPDTSDDFFSEVLDGIEDVAMNKGYTVIFSNSNESYEREVNNLRSMLRNQVAGVLISIAQNTRSYEHIWEIKEKGIPVVFFNRVIDNAFRASKVVVDDFKLAFEATEYLISKGRKKIAYLGGPDNLDISNDRYNGYKTALRKNGLVYKKEYVRSGRLGFKDGIDGIRAILENDVLPDSVFAFCDIVAAGASNEIIRQGLRIPEDIAVVGFGNSAISSLISPSLSTVDVPSYEMGSVAARLLLNELKCEGAISLHKTEILPANLIIRESS